MSKQSFFHLSAVDSAIPHSFINFVFIVKEINLEMVKSAMQSLIIEPHAIFHNSLGGQLERDWKSGKLSVCPRHPALVIEDVLSIEKERIIPPHGDLKCLNDLKNLPADHPCLPKSLIPLLWAVPENDSGVLIAPLVHLNVVPLRFLEIEDTAISLGIQAHHNLLDMFGFVQFVRILAETIRTGIVPSIDNIYMKRLPSLIGKSLSECSTNDMSIPPIEISAGIVSNIPIVNSPSFLDSIPSTDRAAFFKSHLPPSITVRIHFRKSIIDKWRSCIVEAGAKLSHDIFIIDSKLSTNSIVCAVLWQAISKILPNNNTSASRIAIPVDIRRFLLEKEAEKYMGNAVIVVGAEEEKEKSSDKFVNLRNAAKSISTSVSKLDSESSVSQCVNWLFTLNSKKLFALTPFVTVAMGLPRKDVGVTNLSRLSLTKIDFGYTLITAMPDCAIAMPGIASLIDAYDDDGIVAYIGVGIEQKDILISDEFISEALGA